MDDLMLLRFILLPQKGEPWFHQGDHV
jgi:hypothetical protein